MNTKRHEYRTVRLDISLEPESEAWFYAFPFDWVWYRSNQGYTDYSAAREAGEDHIDQIFKEKTVEL